MANPNNPKQIARREKFKRGTLTELERCWRDRKGDHDFEIKARAVQDEELNSRLPNAPAMKTQQWERTIDRRRS